MRGIREQWNVRGGGQVRIGFRSGVVQESGVRGVVFPISPGTITGLGPPGGGKLGAGRGLVAERLS